MSGPAALAPMRLDAVSVQSQVMYGRVGNSAAAPVLQGAGLRVSAVPSVILSNTPHYPTIHGGAVPEDWFGGWLSDLDARGATAALRLIQVGYLGNPGQAVLLARWIARHLETERPPLVQIDPVIGDHDHGIYVDPTMIDAWRELLPLAEGLTPNSFELERLSGMPVDDLDSLAAAARSLLGGRTRWIAVTSATPRRMPAGRMRIALVSAEGVELVEHARIEVEPKGTGDLFSASLAACLLGGLPLLEATREAAARVVRSLELTRAAGCAEMLIAGVDVERP